MKLDPEFWKYLAEEWRRPLRYALLVFVALIPVACVAGLVAPGRKFLPFWGFVAVLHAVMCAVVAAICNLVITTTELWRPRSRLNGYANEIRNFDAALAIWPTLMAVIMIILKCT